MKDYSKILSAVFTVEHVNSVLLGIAQLEGLLFSSDEGLFDTQMGEVFIPAVENVIRSIIFERGKGPGLAGVAEYLKALGEVRLTLAFAPHEKEIVRFAQYLRNLSSKPIVMNISVDQSILGGAVITYQGRFGDYSFAQKLEHVLPSQKEEIMKVLP